MKEPVKSSEEIQKLIEERRERLKELSCINKTNQIIREGKSVEDTLHQIVRVIPAGWQYPEYTAARIIFNGEEYKSHNFRETDWSLRQDFTTIENKPGTVEVVYLQKFRDLDEGPFLGEERDLINNLASIISSYLNGQEAREILKVSLGQLDGEKAISEFKQPVISSRQLLQRFLNKQNANRDIFHDLMPYKVKEILLVATLYDAYSIEKEGQFSEHILGEYQQLNLTSMPRITGVSYYDEALDQLRNKHFDLVILMVGNDKETPIRLSSKIKSDFSYIPIYALLNNNREVPGFKKNPRNVENIDRLFVWNGDSKIFFAMVKHLEDRVNVENDTRIGLVKVILLVEDSEKYYSRYLPLLFNIVLEQTKRIIDDVSTDDLFKILRLRARPKILLASTYEDAIEIIDKNLDNLLCLITDVKFMRNGEMDEQAGFDLVRFVHDKVSDLPTVIQSSEIENSRKAFELQSIFINKNSESLLQDIKSFIQHHLGFGSFVYRDSSGKKISIARTLKEFENHIDTVPIESLIYHGKRNHFSLWLMARGEIKIAKMIHPVKVSDFKTPQEFRTYLKYMIEKYRNETNTGKVINFEEDALLDETNIVNVGMGALGGKGRGLAFINTLIYNMNFNEIIKDINIRTPITCIIGTDEFDIFLERNNLQELVYKEMDYDRIKQAFLESDISYHLEKRLRSLLKKMTKPLAVRSSSLFEDSTMQPFSGIFATYLIPNNHPDFSTRYKQLLDAIRLVYASIYSNNARSYFEAVNYKIEEEKMAVAIQEVVGNTYEHYHYPHISGTAQSRNYYPVAHMEPDDGVVVAAVGLGHYVVEGEKAYRFSPKYPDLDTISTRYLVKNSQVSFYAIDLSKKDANLIRDGQDAFLVRRDISEAEKHGNLLHSASVYDSDNDTLEPGLSKYGPRVINFADILKYGYMPLAQSIEVILDVVKEAMGSPVEIEYAVDLTSDENGKPSFYLLQIKPLVGSAQDYEINLDEVDQEKVILSTKKSMGNGKIDYIEDVVFVDPEHFDKTRTKEMTPEIEALNRKLMDEKRHYILIGPGRWGSRDRFIGIPVAWPQICNARVIVELSMEDFPLDASLGSHFFHNVTSMNVGYFSISHKSRVDRINWEVIKGQKLIESTRYFRHVRFKEPLTVVMDGKKRISVVTWQNTS